MKTKQNQTVSTRIQHAKIKTRNTERKRETRVVDKFAAAEMNPIQTSMNQYLQYCRLCLQFEKENAKHRNHGKG